VWLLVAVILGVVTLVSKLGVFLSTAMAPDASLYNLYLLQDGQYDFSVAGMFAVLLITTAAGLFCIFKYKQLKLQMRICSSCSIFSLLWYAPFVEVWFRFTGEGAFTFQPAWFIDALPLVMAIFFLLARKGVKHDYNLLRSVDRIR